MLNAACPDVVAVSVITILLCQIMSQTMCLILWRCTIKDWCHCWANLISLRQCNIMTLSRKLLVWGCCDGKTNARTSQAHLVHCLMRVVMAVKLDSL